MSRKTKSERKPVKRKPDAVIEHKTVVTTCARCGTTFSYVDDGPFNPNICPDCSEKYSRNSTSSN